MRKMESEMALNHSDQGQEQQGPGLLEPSVGDQLRLGRFLKTLEKADREDLLEICKAMAQQVFVGHPSVVRFLLREATANRSVSPPWIASLAEEMTRPPAAPE